MSMAESTQLSVYVLSMQKQAVLLPADTIAEIIPYEPLQRIEETPDWFLGLLGWRGEQVPVVSFEMLTKKRASFSLASVASASLVIVRGTSDQKSLPFYALAAQTQPVAHDIESGMLFETDESVEKTEMARIRFHNDVFSVPDLDYLESTLLTAIAQ